jgi:phenylpropionate dioxygenase-like ring-hydroxylating dioxygenase large terminal subunit
VEYNDDLCKKDGKLVWKEGKPEKISLRKYPIKELNGYIYVWIHAV